jgi:hypothetical protein
LPEKKDLPSSLMLPSGRVVGLSLLADAGDVAAGHGPSALFSEALVFLERGLLLRSEGRPIEPRSLALCDFHALRAILTRLSWLEEREVTIACRNCQAEISHAPCRALELGPFVDRELHHPELDRTLDTTALHPIPGVRVHKESARTITLGPVTLGQARPLHAALARRRLHFDEAVVSAMGLVALGAERSPLRVARALARCDEGAMLAIGRLFLRAHYPPRLFSIARCGACGARNDVDAPYDRELEPGVDPRPPLSGRVTGHPYRASRMRGERKGEFLGFEAFDKRAVELFAAIAKEQEGEVTFVVEGGIPACDEGGEPLLGSYTAPFTGDASSPSKKGEVTVFYRTFLAIWDEDGPYDWEAELAETVEHELEHHEGHRRGHDEVDLAEQRAIDDEAIELVGARGSARLLASTFARDALEFMRRTWPVWVLVLAATLATVLAGR